MAEPKSECVQRELILLYQTCVTDLAFFKQQQWACANYALLLLAGEVGAAGLLGRALRWYELAVLLAFAALTLVVAFVLLKKHEEAIAVRRDRLDAVRDDLSDDFRRIWGVHGKRDEAVSVCEVLEAVVLAAFGIACWVLVARYGA